MDKVWWNELWMGYPVGPHYAEQSNVTLAHRLTGKLLLSVGELDRNVDPASTMQVVNALIKAGKDFELIVVPGGGHGAGSGPYGNRRRKDFFVKNLLGVEPPDRNNPPPKTAAQAEPKKEPPKVDAAIPPAKAEPKKAPPPEVPDLAALVAKPQSEVRPLVRMYEADQGALRRKYNLPTAEADCARLRKFYSDWSAAVDKVDVSSLSNAGTEDLNTLRKRIEKDRKDVEDGYRKTAEVGPLVPFAPKIVGLELARWKLEPFDPQTLAGRLDELRQEIDKARQAVADPKAHDLPDAYLSKPAVEKAAAIVTELRGVFKYWHDFYAGYDPMFTWWTAEPAKEVDSALDRLAKLMKEKTSGAPAHTGPLRMVPLPRWEDGPSDIPDPKALIQKPSEMAGVVQRYQADILGRGRFLRGADGSPAERRERQVKQVDGWLSALEKIDFDKLSHEGQLDYLLVRNGLRREQDRLKEPATDGPRRRPRDSDEIVGRPIGREALLAALRAEMISYSPEQLVEMANREYAWCEAEMKKAARELGCGDDWKAAVEKVKNLHVAPGGQPKLVRDLALEAIDYVASKGLVTVPPLAAETWRMDMMTPERQRFNPFFTGGEVITVAFPTDTMTHEQKLQALRGNNIHFSRATVHHELIPGHHLQQFMNQRYEPQRRPFGTPFWTEGWAVYWEMVLYEKGFPRGPEDRVGLLFWRMHRCARVIFSLGFHLGKMTPQECIDFLVEKVGHERENATAEVRRSFQGGYPPLYQAGYLVGAKQFWAMRQELVTSGKMTEKAFHDAILKEGIMPVEMVRAAITDQKLSRDFAPSWKFLGDLPAAEWPKK
jgi:uncharacterized protein (DUF885 family)